jgi:hypothetical protein
MRQDQLTRERQKCGHGLHFGTTCERCEISQLRAALRLCVEALGETREEVERLDDLGNRTLTPINAALSAAREVLGDE